MRELKTCRGLLLLALLFCCCGPARGEDGAPLKLHLVIDTCFCPAFEVKSDGDGTLLYNVTGYSELEKRNVVLSSVRLKPTEAEWRKFREALDAAHVWRWHEKYDTSMVLDGTGWEFEAAYDGREVKSTGNNAYPEADGSQGKPPGKATAPFNEVAAAVRKLAGGRPLNSTQNDFSWYGDNMFTLLMMPAEHYQLHAATCDDALNFIRKKGSEYLTIIMARDHRKGKLQLDLQLDPRKQRPPADYDCDSVTFHTALKGLLGKYGLDYEAEGPDTLLIREKK